MLNLKSIHERAADTDGKRYLVELFWPQGVQTYFARVDEWLRELGPSYDLQRFGFEDLEWQIYKDNYRKELQSGVQTSQRVREIANEAKENTVTLLYEGDDASRSHAAVLKEIIEEQIN